MFYLFSLFIIIIPVSFDRLNIFNRLLYPSLTQLHSQRCRYCFLLLYYYFLVSINMIFRIGDPLQLCLFECRYFCVSQSQGILVDRSIDSMSIVLNLSLNKVQVKSFQFKLCKNRKRWFEDSFEKLHSLIIDKYQYFCPVRKTSVY